MFAKYISSVPFPGWNHFMDFLTQTIESEVSGVIFLPFIYGAPTDYSTIYTALLNSAKEATAAGMGTSLTTFDNGLYMKARDIAEKADFPDGTTVVPRLGAFHQAMSLLASIGYIMSGSGITECLLTVYGPAMIKNMLAGRDYARAMRAHFLLQLSLVKIVFEELQSHPQFFDIIKDENNSLMKFVKTTAERSENVELSSIENDPSLKKLNEIFEGKLIEIENRGPTTKLWVSYIRLTALLKNFVASEHMGQWEWFLDSMELMIPIFFATAHLNYAKATQLYLQDMRELEKKMDRNEYTKFT